MLAMSQSRSLGSAARSMTVSPTLNELRSASPSTDSFHRTYNTTTGELTMNLEQTLEKIVEHAHEELRIVRKRAEQKTAARDHGKDYHEGQTAADRLDHYAHLVRRLHDAEYKDGCRHESRNETISSR